jgi:hypothetical protein
VVDTTNFTDKTAFRGSTASLHLVERFTRIDNDTIVYEFTADDPATWTRSWTAQIQLTRIKGPLFEFACHEGNQGVANTLSGARATERAQASLGLTGASFSTTGTSQSKRTLKRRIGFRTNSAGCPPIVPFGSIRIYFQHSGQNSLRVAAPQRQPGA